MRGLAAPPAPHHAHPEERRGCRREAGRRLRHQGEVPVHLQPHARLPRHLLRRDAAHLRHQSAGGVRDAQVRLSAGAIGRAPVAGTFNILLLLL